jgi:hypothetical protein
MPSEDNFEKLQEQHTRGDFYQCRRTYLGSNGEDTLEPPDMFKTRIQMEKIRELKKKNTRLDAVPNTFLNIIKDDPKTVEKNKKAKEQVKKDKEKRRTPSILFLSKYTSLKPQDWTIETQAGVRVYVNKNSGEVATVCPWEEVAAQASNLNHSPSSSSNSMWKMTANTILDRTVEEEEEEEAQGTGALVYDSKGVNDLFEMLDSMKPMGGSKNKKKI